MLPKNQKGHIFAQKSNKKSSRFSASLSIILSDFATWVLFVPVSLAFVFLVFFLIHVVRQDFELQM